MVRFLFLIAILIKAVFAQRITWTRDTIVEAEYQPYFCEGVPEYENICTDVAEFTVPYDLIIDSIYFSVDTTQVKNINVSFDNNIRQSGGWDGLYDWVNGFSQPRIPNLEIDTWEGQKYVKAIIIGVFEVAGGALKQAFAPIPDFYRQVEVKLMLRYEGYEDTLTVLGMHEEEYFWPTNIVIRNINRSKPVRKSYFVDGRGVEFFDRVYNRPKYITIKRGVVDGTTGK